MASANLQGAITLVPYEVTTGDTLAAISTRHGISVETLRSLNKGTLPTQSGDVIPQGQIIYVPAANVQQLPALGGNTPDQDTQKDIDTFVATQASRLGKAYGRNNDADQRAPGSEGQRWTVGDPAALASTGQGNGTSFAQGEKAYAQQQLKSAFEHEATERANALLGGLGTAKVSLGVDDTFKLNRYEADVLAPVIDNDDRMLFVQAGARYNTSGARTIFNLGVGQRHFLDEWMLGYNGFLDYDLSRGHSRLGLGAEAWADYLKLSANLYHPLSSWKDSPDFEEYQERAARGMDINAKYYLPRYPQLGLSAKLEHYLGDEVDLTGNKQLTSNPYAGTLGLEWQPVQLFKVGVNHREAKGSQSDTQINLGFEWKLGASLDDMLNPSKVAASRQLQGMRHDLVERNNNIVLEYKEKARDVAVEHAPITGMSGQTVTLAPSVSLSKGKIVSWQWSAAEPVLQGALSDANIESPTLTLPLLGPDEMLDKTFSLFLTVTDERGGRYQSEAIPVVVQVNPAMLLERLVIVKQGQPVADSVSTPNAEIAVEDDGTVVEFVMVRQHKESMDSYFLVKEAVQRVELSELSGFHVEVLEGELRRRGGGSARDAQGGELVWINKVRVTPRAATEGVPPVEVLSIKATGQAGTSDPVFLTLSSGQQSVPSPVISDLHLAGKLLVGQAIKATYAFDARGGDASDNSTYVWGGRGDTAAQVASGQRVHTSGVVPEKMLTQADVGSVLELSVQAKNGQGILGNTLTVDSSMHSGDGNDIEGGAVVLNPHAYEVAVRYQSSATEALNGVAGERPVANVDEMMAYCRMDGEPELTVCDESKYTLRWLIRDDRGELMPTDITGNRFTARSQDQGKHVLVEAVLTQ